MLNWELYRRADNTLDVMLAFQTVYDYNSSVWKSYGSAYINKIENLAKITSRQVAATIIVTAAEFASLKLETVRNSN